VIIAARIEAGESVKRGIESILRLGAQVELEIGSCRRSRTDSRVDFPLCAEER
jgi:hypothetical protein